MKAIRVERFGPPEVLVMQEVEAPAPTGAGQVLVGVEAVGVNPVDNYVRGGAYATTPALPYTPGSDAAGTVLAVGAGVDDLEAGRRVYVAGSLSGTYAEQALCRRDQVHPLPDDVTASQGAALGVPYATAWRALFQRAAAERGERLLVHGASGGVGLAAVQVAVAAGLEVAGTAGSDEGLRLVAAQGAVTVADHRADGYRETLMRSTAGRGFDVVVELLANVNLGEDLRLLAPRGRVVVVGSRGTVVVDPRDLMSRDASVLGMLLANASAADQAAVHAAIGIGLRDGSLRPVVSHELPLTQAARAHHLLMESPHLGKIVLLP